MIIVENLKRCPTTARCWWWCWIFAYGDLWLCITKLMSASSYVTIPMYDCTYISKLSSQRSKCFNTKCVYWCDPGLRRMKMSIKESKQNLPNWLVMVKITSIPYRSVCFPQMFPIWTSLAGYLVVLQQSMLGRSCNSSINHLTETFFHSRQLVQAVCPISSPSGVAIAHLIPTYFYL